MAIFVRRLSIGFLILLVCRNAAAQTLLDGIRVWDANFPEGKDERPARQYLDLNGVWDFRADSEGVGESNHWFADELSGVAEHEWTNFRVPGVWNEGQDLGVPSDYNGLGWFRRRFDLPDGWYGDSLRVRFLAVYLIADVWLNGEYLGKHRGGYTAFQFDVTNGVRRTGNVLVVRADNTPRRGQTPHDSIDWWNCGGITREVYLERLETPVLEPLALRTTISPPKLFVKMRFQQGLPTAIRLSLYNWKMELQGSSIEIGRDVLGLYESALLELEVTMELADAAFWSPSSPTLYFLKVQWLGGEERTWNVAWERLGFREVATRGSELLLNGEPIWLQGMAFHHDYPEMGSAGTLAAQRADLEASKRLNCNFVRLGHYPFHPFSLDLCDELGLLVWSEIPVWQNSAEDLADDQMNREWVYPQLREMVSQLGNHPSIIIWSVGNEFSQAWLSRGEREDDRIIDYVKRTTTFLRRMDVSRLISYASAASTGVGTWEFLDVVGKPLHYGWFHSNSVYDVRKEVDLVHAAIPDKPILCVELAGMSYPDRHAAYGADERHSLEYHDKLLRVDLQSLMSRRAFVCGATVWTLRDLKGGREVGTYGLFTREGEPKPLYETVKTLYAPVPRVLIHEDKTRFLAGETLRVRLETFPTNQDVSGVSVEWRILGKGGAAVAKGKLDAAVSRAKVESVGEVAWNIPPGTHGFHTLIVLLKRPNGTTISANDFPFDVLRAANAPAELPGVLWVEPKERPDRRGVAGVSMSVNDYPKTSDGIGKVAFVLPEGEYALIWKETAVRLSQRTVNVVAGVETTVSIPAR